MIVDFYLLERRIFSKIKNYNKLIFTNKPASVARSQGLNWSEMFQTYIFSTLQHLKTNSFVEL